MALVRIRSTGEVWTENQFIDWLMSEDGGNTSLPGGRLTPDIIDAHGADPVSEGPQPSGEGWQHVVPDGVEQVGGQWRTKWKLGPEFATPEEQAAYIAAFQASVHAALRSSILAATQARLDNFAAERNYNGIMSACTYVASTVPSFALEGQYCTFVRDQTWAKLYQMLAEIEAGTRTIPASFEEIEGELPVLDWANMIEDS